MAEGSEDTIVITKPGILALGEGLPDKNSTAALFEDNTVTQVACGQDHSAVVLASGQVYVFGKNQDNGWMEQDENVISPPRLEVSLAHVKVVQVACGYQFTLFLTDKGEVYSCGRNESGQLGLGNNNKCSNPQLVNGLPCIKKIAAGYQHSLVLTESREVWVSGCADRGRLGYSSQNNRLSFVCVPDLPAIIDIACGYYCSALLTENRVVLMCGHNGNGQLGLGGKDTCVKFTPVSTLTATIAAVSCGGYHTVCLRYDGSVWAWGSNVNCQLGIMESIKKCTTPTCVAGLSGYTITEVIANSSHTALLTSDGDVLVFGSGDSGELGNKTKKLICVPTLLKKSPELIVKQVAFADTYSLLLIGSKEAETLAEQNQSECKETKTPAEQQQSKEKMQLKQNRACISEMEEKLMKSLECPVCFKVMCAHICQCCNGHSVCAHCRATTSNCSLCREPYLNTRNLNLESLSTVIHLPCVDCLERMPADRLEKHGEVCPYRKYDCPVKQPCGWRGRPENMLSHTSSSHPDQTWQKLPRLFVVDLLDNEASRTYLLSAHNEVFTLHLKYDNNLNKFQAFARIIGPPENVKQFMFAITLIKEDCDKINFFKNVCVDTESIDLLYMSSNCVSVIKEMLDSYLHFNKLVCEVDILKKVSRNQSSYIQGLLQSV